MEENESLGKIFQSSGYKQSLRSMMDLTDDSVKGQDSKMSQVYEKASSSSFAEFEEFMNNKGWYIGKFLL